MWSLPISKVDHWLPRQSGQFFLGSAGQTQDQCIPLRNAENLSENKNTRPFLKKVPHVLIYIIPPVWVSYGYHHTHKLGYLTQQRLTFSQETRSLKSRSWQGWFLLSHVSLPASSGGCQKPLVPIVLQTHTPVFASIFTSPFFCVLVCPLQSYKDTPHCVQDPPSLVSSHLDPYFTTSAKTLFPKNHILRFWVNMNLGNTIHPTILLHTRVGHFSQSSSYAFSMR